MNIMNSVKDCNLHELIQHWWDRKIIHFHFSVVFDRAVNITFSKVLI